MIESETDGSKRLNLLQQKEDFEQVFAMKGVSSFASGSMPTPTPTPDRRN